MENTCDEKWKSNSPNSDSNNKHNQVKLYPVVLPTAPEVTLDAESVNSECEQWTGDVVRTNSITPQTSTINIENSSDVVIGPLTQFHGPVTIYQNINSDLQPSQENLNVECKAEVVLNGAAKPPPESSSSEKLHPSEKRLVTSSKRLAIYASIIIIMLVTIIVSIAVSLNMTSDKGNEEENNDVFPNVHDRENSTLTNHLMFTKSQWGGRPPLNFTRPLRHPTEYVLISHTAGRFCSSFEKCASLLQSIQSDHVQNQKSPDIGYNFLIGGDGNIYVGRGWDLINFHRNKTIGISFIGNYVFDNLTPRMISALKELLDLGVKLYKLPPDYKLVCHNQTSATLSPGENVFKEIIKFPNYYRGHVQIR